MGFLSSPLPPKCPGASGLVSIELVANPAKHRLCLVAFRSVSVLTFSGVSLDLVCWEGDSSFLAGSSVFSFLSSVFSFLASVSFSSELRFLFRFSRVTRSRSADSYQFNKILFHQRDIFLSKWPLLKNESLATTGQFRIYRYRVTTWQQRHLSHPIKFYFFKFPK